MHSRTEHQACVDDGMTSHVSCSQHGWKQKAPAVMSTPRKPASCVYGPSPFGAGLSVWSGGGGGKPFPASAWRQIYLEYIGFTEILSKCKALKRKQEMRATCCLLRYGERLEGHTFASASPRSWAAPQALGDPLTAPTCPPSPLVAVNPQSSGKA